MRGEGEAGVNGGPPGDLFVMVHVASHEFFVRENYNLVTSAKISFPQAALGTTIEVPTIDGTTKLAVPGGTQFGERLHIPNKGVPRYNHYGSGDLIVEIQVETPRNLTEREKEILEAFVHARHEGGAEEHSRFFDKLGNLFNRYDEDES
jgi:molecular chaperone DnaJ